MKLGLVADIHESVELLRTALRHFRVEGVDQVVALGDLFATGERIEETCQLLLEAEAIGVWGNHDYGLCTGPSALLRQEYTDAVVDFMAKLKPKLVISDCLFQHVEPWLDPMDITHLWYFEGTPDEPERLERSFRKLRHRVAFSGHYHRRWLLATPEGRVEWEGASPVTLSQSEQYVVVAKALCRGACAVFDTGKWELVPENLGP